MTEIQIGIVTEGPVPLQRQNAVPQQNQQPNMHPSQTPQTHTPQASYQGSNQRPTASGSQVRPTTANNTFSTASKNFLERAKSGQLPNYQEISRLMMDKSKADQLRSLGDCDGILRFLDERLNLLERASQFGPQHVQGLVLAMNWVAASIDTMFPGHMSPAVEQNKNELKRRVNHLTRHRSPLPREVAQPQAHQQQQQRHQQTQQAQQAQQAQQSLQGLHLQREQQQQQQDIAPGTNTARNGLEIGVPDMGTERRTLDQFNARLKQCILSVETTKETNMDKVVPADPCDKLACASRKLDKLITFLEADMPYVDAPSVPRTSTGSLQFRANSEVYKSVDDFIGWVQVNLIDPVQSSDLKLLRQEMGKKAEGVIAKLCNGSPF